MTEGDVVTAEGEEKVPGRIVCPLRRVACLP